MPQLVIGNKNYSSWSMRPWLVLTRLGVDFQEIRLPLQTPEFAERIGEYSPSRRVPVYRDGDLVIWDSLAICEYLAELHPTLWPAAQPRRARARAVAAEMHAGFAALRGAMPLNCRASGRQVEITPPVARDIARIQALWRDCLAAPDRRGPWLFGDWSIADAMYAPVVSRFATYGVGCDGAVADYVATVLADPALRRWYAEAAAEPESVAAVEVGVLEDEG